MLTKFYANFLKLYPICIKFTIGDVDNNFLSDFEFHIFWFGLWARTACSFRSAQAATLLEFMYHSRIVLSVGGSVWYMIRNVHCTVTIDSVLANSKTQNAFLFTVNAIFLHDYPLAVEPGSSPRPLVQKKLGEILYLLICSFLPCLSWLLRSRVPKSRRDLWITLYITEVVWRVTWDSSSWSYNVEMTHDFSMSRFVLNMQQLICFISWVFWDVFCERDFVLYYLRNLIHASGYSRWGRDHCRITQGL